MATGRKKRKKSAAEPDASNAYRPHHPLHKCTSTPRLHPPSSPFTPKYLLLPDRCMKRGLGM